jgi:integrase
VGANDTRLNALIYYRQYISLRPEKASDRLFLAWRNGMCICSPMGKNTIGGYPSRVATFLCLECPSNYSGHALRRTSATWLAHSGVDIINLKRFGGWASDSVAQGYVAASFNNKRSLAELVQTDEKGSIKISLAHEEKQASTFTVPTLNINNCSNFTININKLD